MEHGSQFDGLYGLGAPRRRKRIGRVKSFGEGPPLTGSKKCAKGLRPSSDSKASNISSTSDGPQSDRGKNAAVQAARTDGR